MDPGVTTDSGGYYPHATALVALDVSVTFCDSYLGNTREDFVWKLSQCWDRIVMFLEQRVFGSRGVSVLR